MNGDAMIKSPRRHDVRSFTLRTILRMGAWLVLTVAGITLTAAQGPVDEPMAAARDEVIREIVGSLPADVPAGPVAVLPPQIPAAAQVDGAITDTWPTALLEHLHRQRPSWTLVDRQHLTDVLREQKFSRSPYAEDESAVQIGKLLSARLLLLTRIHEFRLESGRIQVSLEMTLLDVQTGQSLWARAFTRGIFPFWAKVLIGLVLLVLLVIAWRIWRRRRRVALVHEELPRAKDDARVDVDGLARAAVEARERLQRAGQTAAAAAVQRAWTDLDAVLDRVRHALPGGSVDGSRARDLAGARREAERLALAAADLRRACDRAEATAAAGDALAGKLAAGAADLRAILDAYRRHLS